MMPRRGDLWWVELDPVIGSEIAKTRPCLVVSSSILNQRRRTVVVVPLSTAPQASPPLLVWVTCNGRKVVAVADQVRAVSKMRLKTRLGELSPDDLADVERCLREVLELD